MATKKLGPELIGRQMWWHALPGGWTEMTYPDFLHARRQLIAAVTHEGFKKLSDPNYRPAPSVIWPVPPAAALLTFDALVLTGVIPPGTLLTPTDAQTDSIAEVTEDATIKLDDTEYRTPDQAAKADGAEDADGWAYWSAQLDESLTLAELRMADR